MPSPASTASGPLTALRVLDISEGIAGPFAAKLLADLGADVLKVERPGSGDIARTFGPFPDTAPGPDASGTYIYANTSKRGVTLDTTTARGRDVFLGLARSYDIVVASETEPELAARGLGWDTLSQLNPRLVLVTVTGFGSTGPYAGWATTHLVNCAVGGWANTCGLPGKDPIQAGGNVTDFIAGAYAAVATLLAHEHREREGLGQLVDVSAMESVLTAALLPTMLWEYAATIPERKSQRTTGPSWIMECADGYVGANVLTGPQWEAMCHFIGMPEILDDPQYQLPAARMLLADELHAKMAPWFKERSASEVFHEAGLWRIPFGLIPSMTEVLEMEQLIDRDFFAQILNPAGAGTIPTVGVPFKLPAAPSRPGPAPRLGEHTGEVLTGLLGLSAAEVDELRAAGVC
ncbi:MAG: CoA transferase [Dehalococcoidia bacterium]|nr:CoA transferase [Dehalococcoidia bacterium]